MSVKQLTTQFKAEQLNVGLKDFVVAIEAPRTPTGDFGGVKPWVARCVAPQVFKNGAWVNSNEVAYSQDTTPSGAIRQTWQKLGYMKVWRDGENGTVYKIDPETHRVVIVPAGDPSYPKAGANTTTTSTATPDTSWPPTAFKMPDQYLNLAKKTLNYDGYSFEWEGDVLTNQTTAEVLKVVAAYKELGADIDPDTVTGKVWKMFEADGWEYLGKSPTDPEKAPQNLDKFILNKMNSWANS